MGRIRTRRPRAAPRVALVIETSLASGRDILRGIARYAREHGPWSIYHEPRSLEESVPGWLRDWDGDALFGVKDALVVPFVAQPAGPSPDGRSLDRPFLVAHYDFVLQNEPPASG